MELRLGAIALTVVFVSFALLGPGRILLLFLQGRGTRYAVVLDRYQTEVLWAIGIAVVGLLCLSVRPFATTTENKPTTRSLLVSAVVFAGIFLALVNWGSERLLLSVYTSHGLEYARLLDEYRRTLVQIIGGIAVAGTLYFTYKGSRTTEAALRVSQETLALTRETQITDRFTKAIAQLGATDNQGRGQLVVRIGAIYSLERIAKDSTHDHPTIMKILTAYVRTYADWRDRVGKEEDNPDERIPRDIAAVITVIQTRNARADKEFLDFSYSYLPGVNLENVRLRGVQFPNARLKGALFAGAKLKGANFHFADLTGANFCSSKLNAAMFVGANLEGALFFGADLTEAHLHGAKLLGAIIDQNQLESAVGNFKTELPNGLRRPGHWHDELSGLTE